MENDRVVDIHNPTRTGTFVCDSLAGELVYVRWDDKTVSSVIRREYIRRLSLLEEIALAARDD